MRRSLTLTTLLGLGLAVPLIVTYAQTGLVPRFPTAILVTGLMILATLSGMCGLILDTVVRGRREVRRLAYLAFRAPSAAPFALALNAAQDRLYVANVRSGAHPTRSTRRNMGRRKEEKAAAVLPPPHGLDKHTAQGRGAASVPGSRGRP